VTTPPGLRSDTPPKPRRAGPSRAALFILTKHLLTAEALAAALSIEGFQVEHAVPVTKHVFLSARPVAVLCDAELPRLDRTLELVRRLSDIAPVVVLTDKDHRLERAHWVQNGAAGFFDKDRSIAELLTVLRQVMKGESLLGPAERARLLSLRHENTGEARSLRGRFQSLTPGEQRVLAQLMEGYSALTIAQESWVSLSTVRSQIRSIFRKLGVNSQLQAVAMARRVAWKP
jgi:two-component system, NarL family, nitrate/nitrite response regulator NarL